MKHFPLRFLFPLRELFRIPLFILIVLLVMISMEVCRAIPPTNTSESIFAAHSSWEFSASDPTGNPDWAKSVGIGNNWILSKAPFGNSYDGAVNDGSGTYWPAGTKIWLRKEVNLTGYDLSSAIWKIAIDNGYELYVNGRLISSSYAEGYTYLWEYEGGFGDALHEGKNIIAVVAIDAGGATAFDMMMTATRKVTSIPTPAPIVTLPSTNKPSGKLYTDVSNEFPDMARSSVQCQLDYDQDGKLDLLVWRDDALHLLRKSDERGYAYEDKTDAAGLTGLGFLNCGDIDNDGWPDLLCQSSDGTRIFVLRNQHDGTFQKIEITSLFSGDLANRRTGLSLADIDGDGKLDLVFGINPSWGGGAIVMIRNHSGESGAPSTIFSGKSYLAVVSWNYPKLDLTDANNDGRVDLLVTETNGNWPNDTHPEHPVHLYLNTGKVPSDYENSDNRKSFAGFTEKANCGLNNANEMSPMASFDIDGSGNMSLINGSSDWRGVSNPHIYVNDGKGNYTQMASPIVAQNYYHHGIALFDADLDNRTDGVWTGLHNFSNLYPRMWRNEGKLQFSDVTSEWGITCGIFGSGNLSLGGWACDLDGDGAPEFQSSGGNGWGGGAYNALYRNDAALLGKHFLKVKLVGGDKSPKDGRGARVAVNANGRLRAQSIVDNGGSLNSTILNFGLGTNMTADSVTVYWPSGNVSTLNGVSGDQTVTIQEQAPLPKNLLVNGGFEEPSVRQLAVPWNQSWFIFGPGYAVDYASLPLPGWNVPWGEIDMMRGSKVQIAPAEGEQFIDIDGRMPGAVQQNFSTIPGHHYKVAFDYAGYSPAGLNASVSGESGNTYWSGSYSVGTNNPWSEITCDFDATGNSAMVAFSSAWRANWACGVLIDNVRAYDITEASVPSLPPIAIGGNTGVNNYTNNAENGTIAAGDVTLNGNTLIIFTNANASIKSTGVVAISGTNNLISLSGGYLNGTTNVLLSGTNLSMASGANLAVTGPAVGNGTLSIGQSYTNPGSVLMLQTNATSLYLTVSQDTNSLSQGLVAYYPLNGNALDESGNGRNGISYNIAYSSNQGGSSKGTAQFNGFSSYVGVPLDVSETSYTASLWFCSTIANCGLYSVCYGGPGAGGNDRHIYLRSGNLAVRLWSDEVISTAGVNYADGNWHHVVHLYDGRGIPQRLYVDGVLKATGTKVSSDFNGQNTINIGYSLDASNGYASGQIGSLRIYDRALSSTEVAQIFLKEGGTLSPPAITLNGSNALSIFHGSLFSDPGAVVVDPVDGTNAIAGSGSVNQMHLGSYTLTYNYTNSLGVSADALSRIVSVVPLGGGLDAVAYTNTASNGIDRFSTLSLLGNVTLSFTNAASTIVADGGVAISGSNNVLWLGGSYTNDSTNVLLSGASFSMSAGASIAVTGPAVGNTNLTLGGSWTNTNNSTILELHTNATSLYLTDIAASEYGHVVIGADYNIEVETGYDWGSPESGFAIVRNKGTNAFVGSIRIAGNLPDGTPIERAWPSYYLNTGAGYVLAPGGSVFFRVGPESSNFGGYNKVAGQPDNGLQIVLEGTFDSIPVALRVYDKDIHSGSYRWADGHWSDSYVLQGGDPYGGDTGDYFEVSQAHGFYTFAGKAQGRLADQIIRLGDPMTLSVQGGGNAPLSYAWYHEGQLIAGATNPTFTLASATLSDAGSYQAVVSNSLGSGFSDTAQVGVLTLAGDNPLNITAGSSFSDPGAVINLGSLGSQTITADSNTVNTSLLGTYTISYTASTAAGNSSASLSRSVNVVPAPIAIGGNTGISNYTNTSGSGTVTAGDVNLSGNSTLVYTNTNASIQSTGVITITGTNNLIRIPGGYLNGSTNVLLTGSSLTITPGSTIAVTGPAVGNGTLSIGQSYTNPGSILTLQTNVSSLYLTVTRNTDSLSQGLVAYFPLNGNAMDLSGNGRNGSENGNLNYSKDLEGCFGVFNGTDSYISVANMPEMNNLPLTCSAWVSAKERSDSNGFFPNNVISNDSPARNGHGFGLNVFFGTSDSEVEYFHGFHSLASLYSFAPNTWYFESVVYTPGRVSTYINGNLIDQFNYNQGDLTGTATLLIGRHNFDPGYGTRTFFFGSIKNVRIYNRALSPKEIGEIYTGEGGTLILPEVSLNGSNPLSVNMGTQFKDPGATAVDPVDGTTQINGVGSVDVTKLGSYTLTYGYTNSLGWVSAPISRTVNVVAWRSQTISFPAMVSRTYNSTVFGLSATSSSELPVTFSTPNVDLLRIVGSNAVTLGAGTATIIASQSGSGAYLPADPVTNTLVIRKATASLYFNMTNVVYNGRPRPVVVMTMPGGLSTSVTYNGTNGFSETNAPVDAGTYGVVASINDQNYAGSATTTLTIQRAPGGIISFPQVGIITVSNGPTASLNASASNGLPVNYTGSGTSVAVSGSNATALSQGGSSVVAGQTGDSNHLPAASVTNTVLVSSALQTTAAGYSLSTYATSESVPDRWPTVSEVEGTYRGFGADRLILASSSGTTFTTSGRLSFYDTGLFNTPIGDLTLEGGIIRAIHNDQVGQLVKFTNGLMGISWKNRSQPLMIKEGADGSFPSEYGSLIEVPFRWLLPPDRSVHGVAIGSGGEVYLSRDYSIQRIGEDGNPVLVTGGATNGFRDGAQTEALFNLPKGLVTEGSGVLYVADSGNSAIRKIDTNNRVSTLAGGAANGFQNGLGTNALFNRPEGLAIDGAGVLYVTDTGNNAIRRIDTNGNVTTIAGGTTNGFLNGTGINARFNGPKGVVADSSGQLYVADSGNSAIRRIDPNGAVTTLAGGMTSGFQDGTGTNATFRSPVSLTLEDAGHLLVADMGNNAIRRITLSNAAVTTVIGGGPLATGDRNGLGEYGRLNRPEGIAADGYGSAVVADSGNGKVRMIEAETNGLILTNLSGTFNGDVTLPPAQGGRSLLGIGGNAFANRAGIRSLVIPEGVTTIGTSAFKGCSGLLSLVIPETLTSFGTNIFSGCTRLTNITAPDSILSYLASNAASLGLSLQKQKIGLSALCIGTIGSAQQLPATIPVSGLPVTYSLPASNGVATLTGNTLSFLGEGTTVLTASSAGNWYWGAATATQTVVGKRKPQKITFTLPALWTNGAMIPLAGTSSSGLPLTYRTANTNILRIDGTNAWVLANGKATIVATQPGNREFAPSTNLAANITLKVPAQLLPLPSQTDTFGSGTNTFTIEFAGIGNPGNSNDTTGYGGVPYSFRIGKYTISQKQIDAATKNGLRNVTAGAWSGDRPAANITWYEAAAYVNWLNTNRGYQPAYNLTWTNGAWSMALWPTTPDRNGNVAWTLGGTNLYRNAKCLYFLPSENEWYKAAYYDPTKNGGTGGYWQYPSGSESAPTPVASGTNAETAVYNQPWDNGPSSVFQAGGFSPYGTMGQGGNVWSWAETSWSTSNANTQEERVIRGGGWVNGAEYLQTSVRGYHDPGDDNVGIGFRVARKP